MFQVRTIFASLTRAEKSIPPDVHSVRHRNCEWRETEARKLSDTIQSRLHRLQNPTNCSSAKKLICELRSKCGFGCQIHALAFCLIVAYRTERTLIVITRDWHYARNRWTDVFKPLSTTCLDTSGGSFSNWKSMSVDTQVVYLGKDTEVFFTAERYNVVAIPDDLASRITRLHHNPSAWWIGQFFKYMLKLQPEVQTATEETGSRLGFKHPVVGVHVRRTDKLIAEAKFYDIAKYMKYVEKYYEQLESREVVDKRRVYLATDDPNLLGQARTRYPKYEFIGNHDNSMKAQVDKLYSKSSLLGIVEDVYVLSHADYLIGRLAYELMQGYHADGSKLAHSLDHSYHVHNQHPFQKLAIYDHVPSTTDELAFKKGDIINVYPSWREWNWTTQRSKVKGKFWALQLISNKTIDLQDIAIMPTYEIDDLRD